MDQLEFIIQVFLYIIGAAYIFSPFYYKFVFYKNNTTPVQAVISAYKPRQKKVRRGYIETKAAVYEFRYYDKDIEVAGGYYRTLTSPKIGAIRTVYIDLENPYNKVMDPQEEITRTIINVLLGLAIFFYSYAKLFAQ